MELLGLDVETRRPGFKPGPQLMLTHTHKPTRVWARVRHHARITKARNTASETRRDSTNLHEGTWLAIASHTIGKDCEGQEVDAAQDAPQRRNEVDTARQNR